MKFYIEFVGSNGYAVEKYENSNIVGLELIDLVRKKLNQNLSLELFESNVSSFTKDLLIEISEEVARISGLFQNMNTITVYTEKGFFNNFVHISPVFEVNNEGDIEKVTFKRVLDEEKIIKKWITDGFPSSYVIEEEEEGDEM